MLSDGGGKNGRLPNRIDATKQPNRIALCSKPDFPFPANAAPLLSAIRFAGVRNGRLLDVNDGQVRFTYRDYQADGQQKEMVLPAVEFMRRFLQPVLPKQFVRVRHYGFLAPRYRAQKLARCRALLGIQVKSCQWPLTGKPCCARCWGMIRIVVYFVGRAGYGPTKPCNPIPAGGDGY
jgi:hypothetical protein